MYTSYARTKHIVFTFSSVTRVTELVLCFQRQVTKSLLGQRLTTVTEYSCLPDSVTF
jgi:hypothetical protein